MDTSAAGDWEDGEADSEGADVGGVVGGDGFAVAAEGDGGAVEECGLAWVLP